MRNSITVGILVSICLAVLAAGSAIGQEVENELGIYTDQSASHASTSINIAPMEEFTAYLVLTNPISYYTDPITDEVSVSEMNLITGLMCEIYFPESGFWILSETFSGPGPRYGNHPLYEIGFVPGLPVPDSRVLTLITFNCMTLDTDPKEIFLGISQLSSWATGMEIYGSSLAGGSAQNVYPVSGDLANPVFGINTDVVAIEDAAWGDVKALYR